MLNRQDQISVFAIIVAAICYRLARVMLNRQDQISVFFQ